MPAVGAGKGCLDSLSLSLSETETEILSQWSGKPKTTFLYGG